MSLDFFKRECQENAIMDSEFGLCDNQEGSKAYPDISDKSKWIATVINKNNLPVVFTAIDKCVLLDHEYPNRGRCDCMLTTDIHLYLVELKDSRSDWIANAKLQLESTIDFLNEYHDISKFKKRKVFACNKRKDKFVVIDNETNKQFYKRTSFRLDIQGEIVVI